MKITTTTSILKLRPDGIIEYSARDDFKKVETVETIQEVIDAVNTLSEDEKRGILCFVKSQYISKDVLNHVKENAEFIGMALLTKSFGSKVLGNLIAKFLKGSLVFRVFTDQVEAEKWLANLVEAERAKNNETNLVE